MLLTFARGLLGVLEIRHVLLHGDEAARLLAIAVHHAAPDMHPPYGAVAVDDAKVDVELGGAFDAVVHGARDGVAVLRVHVRQPVVPTLRRALPGSRAQLAMQDGHASIFDVADPRLEVGGEHGEAGARLTLIAHLALELHFGLRPLAGIDVDVDADPYRRPSFTQKRRYGDAVVPPIPAVMAADAPFDLERRGCLDGVVPRLVRPRAVVGVGPAERVIPELFERESGVLHPLSVAVGELAVARPLAHQCRDRLVEDAPALLAGGDSHEKTASRFG